MKKELTKTEQQILAFLTENSNLLDNLTIKEISHRCYCSTTSVHRLLRKLNYSSFKELKHNISATVQACDPRLLDDEYVTFKKEVVKYSHKTTFYCDIDITVNNSNITRHYCHNISEFKPKKILQYKALKFQQFEDFAVLKFEDGTDIKLGELSLVSDLLAAIN